MDNRAEVAMLIFFLNGKPNKERTEAFKTLNEKFGFREYDIHLLEGKPKIKKKNEANKREREFTDASRLTAMRSTTPSPSATALSSDNIVGLDIGTSTIAYVTNEHASLERFCDFVCLVLISAPNSFCVDESKAHRAPGMFIDILRRSIIINPREYLMLRTRML